MLRPMLPVIRRAGAAAAALSLLCACTGGEEPGAGAADVSPPGSTGGRAAVPLASDAFQAEACALADLPTGNDTERAAVGRRSKELLERYADLRSPRSQSTTYFLVASLTTLSSLGPGQALFPSPVPVDALEGATLPNTLDEGLDRLAAECQAAGS